MSRGRELLERQFTNGTLEPDEDRELQVLLRESPELRAAYAKLVELERELEGQDVPEAQLSRLLARGTPPARSPARPASPRPSGRRSLALGLASTLLAAACVLFFVFPRPDVDVRARGEAASAGRPAWLSVFVQTDGRLAPAPSTVPADTAWAFAYTNLRGRGLTHLAVVGLDASGHAHWFHPAYTNAAARPRSVRIEAGVADRELGDLVRVDPAPGPMRVCGLFTEAALDVAEVDRTLERSGRWPPAAHADCRTFAILGAGEP